jgi:signal transduction histidine kinase
LVRDNGIGIRPEDLTRLFRIFERVGDQNQYAGTGVGLSIVKKALEKMNGTVGVESTFGEGSTFWFELRAAPPG